jgi:hypothetical protein
LGRRIAWGHQGHDKTHVHAHLKAQQINVKCPAVVEQLGFNVWHNSSNAHEEYSQVKIGGESLKIENSPPPCTPKKAFAFALNF